MYPRSRLDALSDGIYAVAMTLLVLDIRLPDDFTPRDGDDLLRAILGLWGKFLPYALSFVVLGLRWLSSVKVRARSETVGIDYASWWVAHMLLITCVPFSTMVLGRFAQFAPAVWLYAGNTALIGMIALRMMAMTSDVDPAPGEQERRWSLITLIACSLLAMGFVGLCARSGAADRLARETTVTDGPVGSLSVGRNPPCSASHDYGTGAPKPLHLHAFSRRRLRRWPAVSGTAHWLGRWSGARGGKQERSQ